MNVLELLGRGGLVMVPILLVSLLIWWLGLTVLLARGRPSPTGSLGFLRALTETAPYLGLLGTVSGMMMAFDGLLSRGPGDIRLLSDGISAALITTQAGLLVALCGLFLVALLESRVVNTGNRRKSGRRSRRWRHG